MRCFNKAVIFIGGCALCWSFIYVQDAVVGPFLSLCLASNSDRVVIGVLKVLNVLVKNRENLLRLKELLHFTDALKAASE